MEKWFDEARANANPDAVLYLVRDYSTPYSSHDPHNRFSELRSTFFQHD